MPTDHIPYFAALLGGALLTLQTVLMLSVGAYRNRARKGVGIDGDIDLERLVRRHGNLVENAALFVIVVALYELIFGRTLFLLVLGGIFFAVRLFHMFAFSSSAGSHLVDVQGGRRVYVLMRMAGAGLTAISTLVLGIGLIVSIAMGA